MRLIDADAEIAKIEQKIQRIEEQIKELENREGRIEYYYINGKIKRLRMRISDARSEIKSLEVLYSKAMEIVKAGGVNE